MKRDASAGIQWLTDGATALGGAVGALGTPFVEKLLKLPHSDLDLVVCTAVGSMVGGQIPGRLQKIVSDSFDGIDIVQLYRLGGRQRLMSRAQYEMLRQLRRDLWRSPLRDVGEIAAVKGDVVERSIYSAPLALTFRSEAENLLSSFSPNAMLNEEPFLKSSVELLRLRRRDNPISVNCIAGQAAIIAAIYLMRDILGVPIDLSYQESNGSRQIGDIINRVQYEDDPPYEYVFTSDPDILMAKTSHEENFPLTDHYQYILPIHWKEEFFLWKRPRRGGTVAQNVKNVRFARYGSAEQHAIALRRRYKMTFSWEGIPATEIESLAFDERGHAGVVMWEHSMTAVKDGGWLREPALDDRYWVSLFALRRGKDRAPQNAAFMSCFAQAWMMCRHNIDLAESMLHRADLLNGFRNVIYLT